MTEVRQDWVEVFHAEGDPPIEMVSAYFPRHAFPRHYHHTYVIQMVEEGTDEFLCGHHQFRAAPGTVVAIHPGEVHTGNPSEDGPLTYRALYPSGPTMAQIAAEAGLGAQAPEFESRVIQDPDLAERLLEAHRGVQSGASALSSAQLRAALGELIVRHSRVDSETCRAEPLAVRQARELIESDPSRNFSLDELADYCGYSPYYFLRLFKRAVGLPPHEYTQALRAEKAREMLRQGMPAWLAALDLGYADQAHFTRSFRKISGGTPGAFRRRDAAG